MPTWKSSYCIHRCIFHISSYLFISSFDAIKIGRGPSVGQKLMTFVCFFCILTWFAFSWRPHVIVLTLSCGWMLLFLAPLLNTVLFEENQMKAIQKLRSTRTQLENCLSGALELEHLEPPEDMVMDPARAKFQALGSASPKAGCAQVLNFYRTVSSLRAIRWRCPHVPSMPLSNFHQRNQFVKIWFWDATPSARGTLSQDMTQYKKAEVERTQEMHIRKNTFEKHSYETSHIRHYRHFASSIIAWHCRCKRALSLYGSCNKVTLIDVKLIDST